MAGQVSRRGVCIRLKEENRAVFHQTVQPAFASPFEATVPQMVAILCGVVMEIGDTQLVTHWQHCECPEEWRDHVWIFVIPSTAQQLLY